MLEFCHLFFVFVFKGIIVPLTSKCSMREFKLLNMFQIFDLNNTRMIAGVLDDLHWQSFQEKLLLINLQYLIFNGFVVSLK